MNLKINKKENFTNCLDRNNKFCYNPIYYNNFNNINDNIIIQPNGKNIQDINKYLDPVKKDYIYKSFNDIEYNNYANPNLNENEKIINESYNSNIDKNESYNQSYSNLIENKQYCIRPELDICKYKYTKSRY
jgi:hypothetical protein